MSAVSATKHEVVIIGGGLAGSAAAITLARAGVNALVLEREVHPTHKVCGEFLSEEAIDVLHGLGIRPDTCAAPSVSTLRVSRGNRVFETALPFRARTLSRRLLDATLLQLAEAAGARIALGQHVTGINREDGEWNVSLRSGERIRYDNVMLATGKHDIAGLPRPHGRQNNLVGLKQYFSLLPKQHHALENSIELHLFRGGYAGLQLIEDGTANLCCAVASSGLEKGPSRWPALVERMKKSSQLLCERLDGAIASEEKPMAIAPIPYGMVQRKTQRGLWLLGDQAAVIPSFTGDGMSMALHSGVLAAAALLAGRTSTEFQAEYANAVRHQVSVATILSQRIVHPFEQTIAAQLLRFSPKLLPLIARQTRLPESIRRSALEVLGYPSGQLFRSI